MRPVIRWMRKHRRLTIGLAALLALVAVNVVAFNQAWSMTHFAASGTRTSRPEELGFLDKVQVGLIGVRLPKPANAIDPSHVGLAFETVRFGGSSGAELEGWFVPHVEPRGIVLFAHGYGACKSSLLHEAAAIHRLGYAAFLIDFHGSGGSEGRVTSIGVREADDVADAVAWAGAKEPLVSTQLLSAAPQFGEDLSAELADLIRSVFVQDLEHNEQHMQASQERGGRDRPGPLHLPTAQPSYERLAAFGLGSRLSFELPGNNAGHAGHQQPSGDRGRRLLLPRLQL